jgi:hypothetical protein
VRAYVESLTKPGDLVVDLFCQGPVIVREAAAAGRRALGFSVNPLLLTAARLGLGTWDADTVNAAFTHLADGLKGDTPLRHHLTSLYASTCPSCGESGTAEWFAWDRDGHYPFKKAVHCPQCDGIQEGAPDDADVQAAHATSPRGLAYYYALDRVAPPNHSARKRASELLELYTPRNLSALMDIAMRIEGLETDEESRLVLTAVLLDCFDACSNLDTPDDERPRPRTLRVPSLYLERNVWLCFEEKLALLLAHKPPPPAHQAPDLASLLNGGAEGYVLASYAASDVRGVLQPDSVALIVADPPRPDAVFWALSALWAGWLWDTPAAHRMRPFLRRRRFDWEWHWRVFRAALQAAGPLLVPGSHLVTLFSEPDESLLESACLAASSAGVCLEGWGYTPEAGHRLVWRWEGAEAVKKPNVEVLEQDIRAAATEAAVSILRQRGEPTSWSLLHTGAYVRLAERGLLARAAEIPKMIAPAVAFATTAVREALEAAPAIRLTEQDQEALWWLADSRPILDSLADQVESRVWELFVQQPEWELEDLINATYRHLDGPLTPELALVLICIESYSVPRDSTLHLRSEDDPLQRTAELKTLRDDLAELGKRLGFRVKRGGHWELRWLEEDNEVYVFALSATAALVRHLLSRHDTDEGAQRCLVLPGGRSHLATFKLQRDPRLKQIVKEDEWQFIKFRLLRRLIAKEELDRHALKTVLGLDPIAEQEAAQIPLF